MAALIESGIEPDLLVGTSVGALNAAFLASRPGPEGAHSLIDAWSALSRRRAMRLNPLRALAGFVGLADHLISSEHLRQLIREWVQFARIEQATIRLAVTATDALSGEAALFTDGDVVDTLSASAAIPGLLPPVQIGGRWFVDGSLSANRPVVQAQSLGAGVVYVISTGTAPRQRPPRGAVAVAMNSVSLVTTRQAQADLAKARSYAASTGGEVVVVPPAEPVAPGPFEYGRGAELASASYERTLGWLAGGTKKGAPPAGPGLGRSSRWQGGSGAEGGGSGLGSTTKAR